MLRSLQALGVVSATKVLSDLSRLFDEIENVKAWYDEKHRHLLVKVGLALTEHTGGTWGAAQERWKEVISYGRRSGYKDDHFLIALARLSLIDSQLYGEDPCSESMVRASDETTAFNKGTSTFGMLGLDGFWFQCVLQRIAGGGKTTYKLPKEKSGPQNRPTSHMETPPPTALGLHW